MTTFKIGSLIRVKGTKCEGIIKMIESEDIPDNSSSKKDRKKLEKPAYAYVTLNKGAVYPTMRVFKTKDSIWNLAKVLFEDLEERKANSSISSENTAYHFIAKGDLEGLKKLNKTKLFKEPSLSIGKGYSNTLGYALVLGDFETINYLLESGVPLQGPKEKYFSFLLRNVKLNLAEQIIIAKKLNFQELTNPQIIHT